MKIKPHPRHMRALQDFPFSNNKNVFLRVLGMFAYHNKWINYFDTKLRLLAETKAFSLSGNALDTFVLPKSELLESNL